MKKRFFSMSFALLIIISTFALPIAAAPLEDIHEHELYCEACDLPESDSPIVPYAMFCPVDGASMNTSTSTSPTGNSGTCVYDPNKGGDYSCVKWQIYTCTRTGCAYKTNPMKIETYRGWYCPHRGIYYQR